MTEYKDQGLKKAAKQSKTPQLPSNFTYRMMKRIGEEMYLREKRQEKTLIYINDYHCHADDRRMSGYDYMDVWKRNIRRITCVGQQSARAFITPFLSSDADCTTFTENFRPLVKT